MHVAACNKFEMIEILNKQQRLERDGFVIRLLRVAARCAIWRWSSGFATELGSMILWTPCGGPLQEAISTSCKRRISSTRIIMPSMTPHGEAI